MKNVALLERASPRVGFLQKRVVAGEGENEMIEDWFEGEVKGFDCQGA